MSVPLWGLGGGAHPFSPGGVHPSAHTIASVVSGLEDASGHGRFPPPGCFRSTLRLNFGDKKVDGPPEERPLMSAPGFGIAGSARVGGSARGPDPPVGGGVPTLGFGERFFEKFPQKWLFLGMFV